MILKTSIMFKNFSKEQALRIASFIIMGTVLLGVDLKQYGLDEGSLADLVFNAVIVISMLADATGYLFRYAKGDVTLAGFRVE